MEIRFQTKGESNEIQRDSFLQLSKIERIYSFLNLMHKVNQYPTKVREDKSANFLLVLKSK